MVVFLSASALCHLAMLCMLRNQLPLQVLSQARTFLSTLECKHRGKDRTFEVLGYAGSFFHSSGVINLLESIDLSVLDMPLSIQHCFSLALTLLHPGSTAGCLRFHAFWLHPVFMYITSLQSCFPEFIF